MNTALLDPAVPATELLVRALTDEARPAALFLDVDGTLLDIAERPDEVVVPDELRHALATLHEQLDGALALVSGRPIEELDRIFAPLALPGAGAHGAHWRTRGGGPIERLSGAKLPPALRKRLLTIVDRHPRLIHEDKGSSIAIHFRNAPALGERLASQIQDAVDESGEGAVSVLPGKAVLEVKQGGFDKARAVRTLLAADPFRGRRPVFIGDDVTDRVALDAVASLDGVALSVERPIGAVAAVFESADAVRRALVRAAHLMEKAP